MPPQRRANCQICREKESRYTCSVCEVLYCSVPCYKQHKSHSCSASAKTRKTINTIDCADARERNGSPREIIASPTFPLVPTSTSLSAPPLAPTRETIDGKEAIHDQRNVGDASTSADNERQPSLASSSIGAPQEPQPELRSQLGLGRGDASHVRQGQLEKRRSSARVGRSSADDGRGEMEDDSEAEAPESPSQSQKQSQTIPEVGNTSSPSPPPKSHPLRSLASLKWPYVPDTPSYADPLTRDDPKPLTLPQYEAIARSPTIRSLLSSDSNSKPDSGSGDRLRELLKEIDTLRGGPRERAIERVLGVAPEQSGVFSLAGTGVSPSPISATQNQNTSARRGERGLVVDEEDMRALRKLAEAVEVAVRSVDNPNARLRSDPLGLDWESMEA